MKIEVQLMLEVDPEANFLEADDETTLDVLMELVKDQFYDLDDVIVKEIALEKV